MDCVSPILDVATRLWDCSANSALYIRELQENLKSLKSLTEELSNLSHGNRSGRNIAKWGSRNPKEMSRNLPQELLVKLQAGKIVTKKINAVTELKGKGNFDVVAERLPSAPVDERPIGKTVGLDLMFEKVRRCLEDEQVRSIELYGIGGVGKNHPLAKNQ
ncbi:hypothetical protein CK203_109562 [Vitis vinifera]|uniref:Disease resistance protein n=1 Tax=Vitis vinifera TaxID=29760 RepID=A0A438CF00_VITVI|nr:hypothetical protein CK203_109562 [Vitis vinifera]